jgi:uncharacterized protein YecE (DUF72 family)
VQARGRAAFYRLSEGGAAERPARDNMMPGQLRIGCAGWTIPKQHATSFPPSGSHLERYAQRFAAVEINSSFRRPHRRTTYERWSSAVPGGFAFSVKAPKEITHSLCLAGADAALDAFLEQATGLGSKLGPLLFQLPPSLAFDPQSAGSFFAALRTRFDGGVVCEPRHPDWFTVRAEDLLMAFRISRVAADPPVVSAAAVPGGWNGLAYFRLHGFQRVYYSKYRPDQIEWIAQRLGGLRSDQPVWCIFDNTAAGAATANALALQERVEGL